MNPPGSTGVPPPENPVADPAALPRANDDPAPATLQHIPPISGSSGWKSSLVLGIGLFLVYSANGREIGSGDTVPAMFLPVAILRGDGPFLDRFRTSLHAPGQPLPYDAVPRERPRLADPGRVAVRPDEVKVHAQARTGRIVPILDGHILGFSLAHGGRVQTGEHLENF